ncbi:MAG: formylglycine-generating enzyme family protein [Blastomonas sp.]|nr:formylglycine-generating enzyme family protein [Blastomonas sp.]
MRGALALLCAASLVLPSCREQPATSPEQPATAPGCADTAFAQGRFITLPPGSFVKGADPLYPEEGPSMRLSVSGFAIQAHEVTNDQFAAFATATGYVTEAEKAASSGDPGAGSALFTRDGSGRDGHWVLRKGATWRAPEGQGSSIAGKGRHPVVHVTLADARAYAAWAGGRLPTEEEWEYAASTGLPDPANRFSGAVDESGTPRANHWQGVFPVIDEGKDGFSGTAPAACFPADRNGVHDLIGNVWEWTDSPVDDARMIIKGGSWLCAANFCARYRPAARQPQEADFSSNHIGFRIIRDAAAPASGTAR